MSDSAEKRDGPEDLASRAAALRTKILQLVGEYVRARPVEPSFVPGETPIRYAGRVYDEDEVVQLVDSGLEFWLTAGRYADQLERDLASFYGLPHALLVNSGSSANLLAVAALTSHEWGPRRLAPGDEVITVAAGFPSTVTPIFQVGAVPVFVDVALPSYNVDTSRLEQALSPRTRALILAHTLGNPFELDAVLAFCRRHDLWLIEDNCDANGSKYRGRLTGTFGDLSTLSFYPPHHMTTGEGGAVLTRSAKMARVVSSYRDWGRDCWCASGRDNTCRKRFSRQLGELPAGYDHKYTYSHLGYNLKMTDPLAAVGLAQLRKLPSFIAARRENWSYFRAKLASLDRYFRLPEAAPDDEPSWFGFMLTVRREAAFSRDEVVQALEARKIQTRMLFGGNLVRQPALVTLANQARSEGRPPAFRVVGDLAVSDEIMNRAFWFGVYPGITSAMREYVADTLLEFVRQRSAGPG